MGRKAVVIETGGMLRVRVTVGEDGTRPLHVAEGVLLIIDDEAARTTRAWTGVGGHPVEVRDGE